MPFISFVVELLNRNAILTLLLARGLYIPNAAVAAFFRCNYRL